METQPTQTPPEPNLTRDESKYPIGKLIIAYLIAMVLGLLVFYGIGSTLAVAANWIFGIGEDKKLNWYEILMYVGALWAFLQIGRYFVSKWRSNDGDINLGLTTFDNPFYDPNFESKAVLRDKHLKVEKRRNRTLRILLQRASTNLEKQKEQNEIILNTLEVFVRHHDNASRLIESATYLASVKESKFVDEMINNVLSECMTILYKDRSDKSATLFQLEGEVLRICGYTRIKALSSRSRKFKKGEGFAGFVWETNESVILNKFEVNDDKRFSGDFKPHDGFKSIIGVPCKIGDQTAGVLCIQSEYEDGFRDEDLRTIQFYANCCSLIFLYDKINKEGGAGND